MKSVSVILASYNGEKYIKEQLDSILTQTYPIHEILIGDDGSTDNTMNILSNYAHTYSHIKIIHPNRKHHGVNYNFKRLMDIASSDYIAFADQDDIWLPNKIEVMIKEIGEYLLAYSDAISFSGITPNIFDYQRNAQQPLMQEKEIENIMFNNIVSGHRMLVKREFINEIREWNFDVYYDWWLAISASYRNSILYIPYPLVFWRRHDSSMTLLDRKKQKKILRVFQFIKRRYLYFCSLLKLFKNLGIKNDKQALIYRLACKFASKSLCLNIYGCFYYCIRVKSSISYHNFMKPLKMWSK